MEESLGGRGWQSGAVADAYSECTYIHKATMKIPKSWKHMTRQYVFLTGSTVGASSTAGQVLFGRLKVNDVVDVRTCLLSVTEQKVSFCYGQGQR